MKSYQITKVITIKPHEDLSVYNSMAIHPIVDISLKTTNVNLMVVLEEKSGDHIHDSLDQRKYISWIIAWQYGSGRWGTYPHCIIMDPT